MTKKSILYRLSLGLLIGFLIMSPQTAQAQFLSTPFVFDAKNYALNVKKSIEDTNHYIQIIDTAIAEYTTLTGVLGKAEELVTDRYISKQTMADLGVTIRTCFEIKDRVRSIIRTRLTMLQSIDNRLRSGILDPEADKADLEHYLRGVIGRSSLEAIATQERLRDMDNVLERWELEIQQARADKANTQAEIKRLSEIRAKVKKDGGESMQSSEAMLSIDQRISALENLSNDYDTRIQNLECQIEQRYRSHYNLLEARITFGKQVKTLNREWGKLNEKLIDFDKSLERF